MSILYEHNDPLFGLSHTLTDVPNPDHFFLHTHAKAELYYFVKGSGIFHIEGSAYQLEPGDLLLMRPTESHYIEVDVNQPYERKVLHFSMDCLKALDPIGCLFAPLLDREAGKMNLYKPHRFQGGSCEHYIHTMMSARPDPQVSIFAGLVPLLHELCGIQAQLMGEPNTEPDSIEYRIMRYLNENIDKPVSLNDVCQRFYISKSQLCRIFRSCTGVTVKQYLTVKRLVRAKQLIDLGEHPTHIYSQCGFNDYSSFYRAYTKYYGHSPAHT